MAEQDGRVTERIVEKTVVAQPEREEEKRKGTRKVIQIIDYIYWVVMALFLIRFVFRLVGALKASNPIVNFVYTVTSPIYKLFVGIAPDWHAGGAQGPVVELSDLVALLLIWVLYHAVLKLVDIMKSD